jgi:hypothetical protein
MDDAITLLFFRHLSAKLVLSDACMLLYKNHILKISNSFFDILYSVIPCMVHFPGLCCFKPVIALCGAHGSIVGWGTMIQAGRSRFWVPMRWIFSIYLILQLHYSPGVDSASNKNEYQESSWGTRIALPFNRFVCWQVTDSGSNLFYIHSYNWSDFTYITERFYDHSFVVIILSSLIPSLVKVEVRVIYHMPCSKAYNSVSLKASDLFWDFSQTHVSAPCTWIP